MSMVGLCGHAGFSIDVSSWYHTRRKQHLYTSDDTVTVRGSTTAPNYFLKVRGINSADVSATAKATAVPPGTA
jgi:hypothetical protein